jgi:hypothetical protein
MARNRIIGIALVVIGVLFNNYVYLHDLITDQHDGFIGVGLKSLIGIGVSWLAVAAGLVLLLRRPPAES